MLRARIENVERELSYATKDYKRKKTEFEKAKAYMEKKETMKQELTEHLRMIIYESEKKKEEKLKEMMSKLGMDTENSSSKDTPQFKGFASTDDL